MEIKKSLREMSFEEFEEYSDNIDRMAKLNEEVFRERQEKKKNLNHSDAEQKEIPSIPASNQTSTTPQIKKKHVLPQDQHHPIEMLGLSGRPLNCLKRAKIDTVEELQQTPANTIRYLQAMGSKSYNEIQEALKKWNGEDINSQIDKKTPEPFTTKQEKNKEKLDELLAQLKKRYGKGLTLPNTLSHLVGWNRDFEKITRLPYYILSVYGEDPTEFLVKEGLIKKKTAAEVQVEIIPNDKYEDDTKRITFSSFSWDIVGDEKAIKHCDKTFFEHHETGIPQNTLGFWEVENLKPNDRKIVKLFYKGSLYYACFSVDSLNRVRLIWTVDLQKKLGQNNIIATKPIATFLKVDDTLFVLSIKDDIECNLNNRYTESSEEKLWSIIKKLRNRESNAENVTQLIISNQDISGINAISKYIRDIDNTIEPNDFLRAIGLLNSAAEKGMSQPQSIYGEHIESVDSTNTIQYGSVVRHRLFGEGKVVYIGGDILKVRFEDEIRQFRYPEAIEKEIIIRKGE